MKLLLLSDVHARFLAPENRTETDFFESVVMKKLDAVFSVAKEEAVDAICQAGDLTDSYDPSKYVLSKLIRLFRFANVPFFTVMGQHDCAWRQLNDTTRTASYLLESAGVIQVVGLDNQHVTIAKGAGDDVIIHGLSFEQDHNPIPIKGKFNILIAHATVGEKPLYPGHALKTVRQYVQEHKGHDVILLGDIHMEFQDVFMGCQVFNTGPLIRKSISEKDEHPNVVIYDTQTRTSKRIEIPHRSWQECFNLVEAKAVNDSKLQEFIDVIKSQKKLTVSFDDNLRTYFTTNQVTDPVKDAIAGAMHRAGMSIKELREAQNA